MHPLIARIHPAVRTAFFAWLLSRAALWIISPTRPDQLATGTPLPGLADEFFTTLEASVSAGWTADLIGAAPWIILEMAMLLAGIAVYRFARRTDLARLAERACWLWFFNPVVALAAADWGAQLAIAAGTIAVGSVATAKPRHAVVAAVVAVGCRPEFVLLWPAFAVAAWQNPDPDRDSPMLRAVAVAAVPAAFAGWIAASWHLAGAANTSLREVGADTAFRDASTLLPGWPEGVIAAAAMVLALGLALRYLRRFPGWYALAAVPALVWALAQVPIVAGAVAVAWSLPTFAHLGVATDDRGLERAVLAGMIVAFVVAAAG